MENSIKQFNINDLYFRSISVKCIYCIPWHIFVESGYFVMKEVLNVLIYNSAVKRIPKDVTERLSSRSPRLKH